MKILIQIRIQQNTPTKKNKCNCEISIRIIRITIGKIEQNDALDSKVKYTKQSPTTAVQTLKNKQKILYNINTNNFRTEQYKTKNE